MTVMVVTVEGISSPLEKNLGADGLKKLAEAVGAKPGDYYPQPLRGDIDAINQRVYDTLNNGVYKSGFATTQIPAISVVTGVDHSVGKQVLGVGTSTTVTVESQAGAQIETVQSQVTTTFDTQQISNLPTAGGFDELALLIPGVVDVHADNFSNTNGVGISVNGERGRAKVRSGRIGECRAVHAGDHDRSVVARRRDAGGSRNGFGAGS